MAYPWLAKRIRRGIIEDPIPYASAWQSEIIETVEKWRSELQTPTTTHSLVTAGRQAVSSPQDQGILSQDPGIVSGETMATDPTLQTLRAGAGFTMPPELKQYLPLILVFALFVLILIKK